ncbi:hypothetical protein K1W54_09155 [Micromonospora sp. CPCC 205371]|nr:hypothetical protein [Micromonospora sp. CPCC 205371]
MHFRTRALAYVGAGAAGLFATGLFAAPALAADEADVLVKPLSTKIAVDAGMKFFRFDFKNEGPGVATDTTLTFDLSGLDPNVVDFNPEEIGDEDVKLVKATEDEIVIEIGDGAPGETLPVALPIVLKDDAETGPAGSFKVSIKSSAPDPDESNNSATIPVEVVESGPDLTTIAYDVRAEDGEPVEPGATAPFFWSVANEGDQTVKGVALQITLPKHVTFVEDYPACTTTPDRRILTCENPGIEMEPGYGIEETIPVKVSADAPGPVTLSGGLLKAVGTSVIQPELARGAKAAKILGSFEVAPIDEESPADVDPADNTAEFAVFVGGTGGGGGGGGDLPVTGVQAGLIGGVGLAVLAGGGALLVMSRRRKVVLVTPGDETPTA